MIDLHHALLKMPVAERREVHSNDLLDVIHNKFVDFVKQSQRRHTPFLDTSGNEQFLNYEWEVVGKFPSLGSEIC
jgi:hypothetical protein